ncbi:MAG: hypothetical protein ACRDZO_09260 [Egibacteraceae bacterium]
MHGGAHPGDHLLLLAIFLVMVAMLVGGFFLIYRPLKAQSDNPPQPEDNEG